MQVMAALTHVDHKKSIVLADWGDVRIGTSGAKQVEPFLEERRRT